MISAAVFWTDESNFDIVKEMLKADFGLVPPIRWDGKPADEDFLRSYLVYEDPSLVSGKMNGVYRVNFCFQHPRGTHIGFRYFGQRLNDLILSRDPMKPALQLTYDLLKPVVVTDRDLKPINMKIWRLFRKQATGHFICQSRS